MTRTIDEWEAILKPLIVTNVDKAAQVVLGDLVHYFNGRAYESDDIIQLANAMEAYYRVRVPALTNRS